MRRPRGFTLIELMVVVTLTGVLASLAILSWRKTMTTQDVDKLSNAVRDAITQAARRAVSTQRPYMVTFAPGYVQWCQVAPANYSAGPPALTTQTSCASVPEGTEVAPAARAGDDAIIAFTAPNADVTNLAGTYVAPSKTTLSTTAVLYLGPNGSADANFANVMALGVPSTGFTAYLRRKFTDDTTKHRRVIVYGVSARPRVIDNW
jgi:prepilin-type N-terminal cleavage/methylation domain-containing protein